MIEALFITGIFLVAATLMIGLVIFARRVLRRTVAGSAVSGAMAAYNEAYTASAFQSHLEVLAEKERVKPVPTPSDQ